MRRCMRPPRRAVTCVRRVEADCPFDPERGPGYIRETIKIIESIETLSKADKEKLYYKNLENLTGKTFVK